ncbi:hypothetical protein CEXT_568261 [Caerostris extrusa]|uniref:Uncharacterized protein n=1 Tax=Caerostris extrusa TaxID=172846 RepID=A0AAV4V3S5_CAEEX|nr:hypothetical protein CEXT_568261 [Caerostris extrusa]
METIGISRVSSPHTIGVLKFQKQHRIAILPTESCCNETDMKMKPIQKICIRKRADRVAMPLVNLDLSNGGKKWHAVVF